MEDMGQLYIEYSSMVKQYLYTICGDEWLAEEIMQETFFQIILHCGPASQYTKGNFFRKKEPVEEQIYRLAGRLLRAELARREKAQAAERSFSILMDIPPLEYQPETFSVYQEELRETQEKMRCMEEPERTVLVLKYYQDMTYKEIAACLQKSENWVKYMLSVGKLQIEHYLR